jgi:hypothetical protein
MAKDNIPGMVMSPEMSVILHSEVEAGTRFSTPEESSKNDPSLSVHFVDSPTCNQAKRIFEMWVILELRPHFF